MEKSYLCERRRPREQTEGAEKGLGFLLFGEDDKDGGTNHEVQQDDQHRLSGPNRQMAYWALFEFVVGSDGMKVRSL